MIVKNVTNKTNKEASAFYSSKVWKDTKKLFLESQEMVCRRCGSIERLCVDHIKPIKWYWDLRLDKDNLQVLCNKCNLSKGSGDSELWYLQEKEMKQVLKDRYLEKNTIELNEKLKYLIENKDNFILKNKKYWLIKVNSKEISLPEGMNNIKQILNYLYEKEIQKIEQKIKTFLSD